MGLYKFTDVLGHEINVGDLVAFGSRDANVANTKIAHVVSIDWLTGVEAGRYDKRNEMVPKVGVRTFITTRWGRVQSAGHVRFPTPENLVRLNYSHEAPEAP